ncbi:MAG: hypothetical protein GY937_19935, partial [bacterium]|nr:hypothetical protein [bacterium]
MFPVSIQDKLSKTPLIITKRRQAAVATVDGNARELGMTTAVRKPFHDYLRDSSDDEQGAGASADTDYTLSPPANKILAATHLFMCLAAGAIDDATATAGTEWAGGSALTNGHEFFFLMDGVEYNIHRIADDTEVQSHADVLTHGWEILKGPTVDWHSSNF